MNPNLGATRTAGLQEGLRTRGIDALISFKPENSFYLSGFNPIIYRHPVVALLPAKGESAVLVHALRDDHARASSWVRDIRLYGAWSTKKTMGPNWLDALREMLVERGVADGVLGFEGDYLPVQRFEQLKKLLPGARFEDTSDLLEHSRYVKDAEEEGNQELASFFRDVPEEDRQRSERAKKLLAQHLAH